MGKKCNVASLAWWGCAFLTNIPPGEMENHRLQSADISLPDPPGSARGARGLRLL